MTTPTPLEAMRSLVRRDVRDEAAAIWSNDEVDRAIARALAEYSAAYPLPAEAEIATTAASDEVDISTLAPVLEVRRVEFPMDLSPRRYPLLEEVRGASGVEAFRFLAMQGNGDDCRVDYSKPRTIDAVKNDVPAVHQGLVAMGAGAFLSLAAAVASINTVNVGGVKVDHDYQKWGLAMLDAFQRKLRVINRAMTTARLIIAE